MNSWGQRRGAQWMPTSTAVQAQGRTWAQGRYLLLKVNIWSIKRELIQTSQILYHSILALELVGICTCNKLQKLLISSNSLCHNCIEKKHLDFWSQALKPFLCHVYLLTEVNKKTSLWTSQVDKAEIRVQESRTASSWQVASQRPNTETRDEIHSLEEKPKSTTPTPSKKADNILAFVKRVPVPCIETELPIFQCLPISLQLWHNSFDQRFIILSTIKFYTPNWGHKRGGRGISLLKAGSIFDTNIWYRKLNSHTAVLCCCKWP